MTKDEYVAKHFPEVEMGVQPCGNKIIVQLRTTPSTTAGGIALVQETKQFNDGNTQLGRLVKLGQIAYRDRNSGEEWKEGAWAKVGDIVVLPRWGGFRFEVPIPGTEDKAIFSVFDDFNLNMVVEDNFEAFDSLL